MSKLMLQKNPLFLSPISYFGSAQQFDQELSEEDRKQEWGFSCGFILELEKSDPFQDKIGSFLLWTENSFLNQESDIDF